MGRHALPPHKQKKKFWFVLAVELGMDSRVKKDLRKEVKKNDMSNDIGRVVIPRKPQRVWIGDEEKIQKKMMYPGYLLVHCRYNDDVFHLIQGVRGTYGLLMNPREPIALTSQEEAHVFIKEKIMNDPCQKKQEPVNQFKEGQSVRVVDGSWVNYEGPIKEVSRNHALVELELMGRKVIISIPTSQLEKL